jgi:F0F1-type ATP synthase membrane subunit b/b'
MSMEAVKVPTMEQKLAMQGALMIRNAQRLTIANNEDYEKGTALLKDIKARTKEVKDYWKEPKAAAQKAHKTLVAREAEMLKPLESAEAIVKRAMLEYTTAIEKARREAEEAARREREAEAQRLAEIAAQAEETGDEDTAEIMRDMAEAVPMPEVTAMEAPKPKGVSVRKTWKARVTDPKQVPTYFDGYELREINMTMLNNLARWKEGQMEIPGVEFYQDTSMSVRS